MGAFKAKTKNAEVQCQWRPPNKGRAQQLLLHSRVNTGLRAVATCPDSRGDGWAFVVAAVQGRVLIGSGVLESADPCTLRRILSEF